MARQIRIEFPGAIYHITSRGNAKQDIFVDPRDRQYFLSVLTLTADRYEWVIHSYCLMPNHYHLLMETGKPSLSIGMRYLNSRYAQRFNTRHERTGHLLQGRFKAILVERQSYLLELCRYVVLNPVRAGLVSTPDQWKWSSYLAIMRRAPKPRCLYPDWILAQFSDDSIKARRRYERFVLDGIGSESPWSRLRANLLLGDRAFAKDIGVLVHKKTPAKGTPKFQGIDMKPSLHQIFKSSRKWPLCFDEVCIANFRYGYNLKQIAEHLHVHPSTLTKALRKRLGDSNPE
jgi:putative transposase